MIGEKELENLTNTILETYGLDFRDYASSSLARRIQRLMDLKKIPSVDDLLAKIKAEEWFHNELLEQITVNVTEMFRDPEAWVVLRTEVLPKIRFANEEFRIWHAGCSSGEEVFSMAILLRELNYSGKIKIVASDLDQNIINSARNGTFLKSKLELNSKNYKEAGGIRDLSNYYSIDGTEIKMDPSLLENVSFEIIDLVKDPPNGMFDLILCRNVMIYFNQNLQNKVLDKIFKSLCPGGYLSIGTKESLLWCDIATEFKILDPQNKVYQKPFSDD
jgi:chemotaxis protein methyltransferase CheR